MFMTAEDLVPTDLDELCETLQQCGTRTHRCSNNIFA